jgi:SAM-dependent methyltransferase
VTAYHKRLLADAAIDETERVLDVGCGTGQTTRDAARAAASGSALGVDLSSAMIEHARTAAAAESVGNARFEQADAQIHPFDDASYDIAISRTGAMFFGDPVAAFANIRRALRPGGRLVLVTWQSVTSNEWIRELSAALAAGRDLPTPPPDAPGPFSLAQPDRVRAVLTAAGLTDVQLDAMSAPMWFGSGADDAYRFVLGLLGWMLDGLDHAGTTRALGALRSTVAAHETAAGVVYESGAWIVHAARP